MADTRLTPDEFVARDIEARLHAAGLDKVHVGEGVAEVTVHRGLSYGPQGQESAALSKAIVDDIERRVKAAGLEGSGVTVTVNQPGGPGTGAPETSGDVLHVDQPLPPGTSDSSLPTAVVRGGRVVTATSGGVSTPAGSSPTKPAKG